VKGQDPTNDPKSAAYRPRYYALRNGRNPGIYETWDLVQEQLRGIGKADVRSFPNRADAEEYMKTGTLPEEPAPGISENPQSADAPEPKRIKVQRTDNNLKNTQAIDKSMSQPEPLACPPVDPKSNTPLIIYTDGSSLGNGKQGASAGIGVWFGNNDVRYISQSYYAGLTQ